MRFLKLKWTVLAGASLGVLVPIAFLLVPKHAHHLFGSRFDLYLWPSAIILMATENQGYDLYALAVLVCSIALNVVYYVLVAALLWCIVRVFIAGLRTK